MQSYPSFFNVLVVYTHTHKHTHTHTHLRYLVKNFTFFPKTLPLNATLKTVNVEDWANGSAYYCR